MVYAAVVGCPVPGGSVKTLDDAAAKAMRGVVAVINLDTAIAVVADRFWRAKRATEALKVEWNPGAGAGSDSAQFANLGLLPVGLPGSWIWSLTCADT
jgi:isoquinoline 1-oxidoreductase beta subunit